MDLSVTNLLAPLKYPWKTYLGDSKSWHAYFINHTLVIRICLESRFSFLFHTINITYDIV